MVISRAVRFEQIVFFTENRLGDLRRKIAFEPGHAFEIGDLFFDRIGERPVPLLQRVVHFFDPHHRAHPRQELERVEGLGDVVVGAGVEAGDFIFLGRLGREQNNRDALVILDLPSTA